MQNKKQLSKEDVVRLSASRSAENKIMTVQKLSSFYNTTNISIQERKLAEDIFRIMVEDVEVKVRQILSECLNKMHHCSCCFHSNLALLLSVNGSSGWILSEGYKIFFCFRVWHFPKGICIELVGGYF